MLRTVVAIERDGFDIRVLALQFDVSSELGFGTPGKVFTEKEDVFGGEVVAE